MLVSGSVPVRNYQDVVSQKITTFATRQVAGYSSAFVGKKKQRARIKFRKIKIADKVIAPAGIGDDYAIDEEAAIKLEKKLRKQEFTLQDYLDQLKQIKKMGSFSIAENIKPDKYVIDIGFLPAISPTFAAISLFFSNILSNFPSW